MAELISWVGVSWAVGGFWLGCGGLIVGFFSSGGGGGWQWPRLVAGFLWLWV